MAAALHFRVDAELKLWLSLGQVYILFLFLNCCNLYTICWILDIPRGAKARNILVSTYIMTRHIPYPIVSFF